MLNAWSNGREIFESVTATNVIEKIPIDIDVDIDPHREFVEDRLGAVSSCLGQFSYSAVKI